jgi:ApbE superfamily uncharacterized protein (UPF0280 family)
LYKERTYRKLLKGAGAGLEFFNVCVCETDLWIGADSVFKEQSLQCINKYRTQIEEYIKSNKVFMESLEPLLPESGAPEIVKRMCAASVKTGVGPMASVAGAVAEMTGMKLLRFSKEVIVENGGDIFIKTCIPRKVGIYAGSSPLSMKVALDILPENTPAGICTSSGTVGHSLSFGRADAAVIISRDCFIADAAATAAGNIVKRAEDIEKAIDFVKSIKEVEGIVVIAGDKIGAWGNVSLTSF